MGTRGGDQLTVDHPRIAWTDVRPRPGRSWMLWAAAILLYGCGDLVTTYLGVRAGGVSEANALLATVLAEFGLGGLLVVKLAVLVASVALWGWMARPYRSAVPAILTANGTGLTLWNLGILLPAVV